MLQRTLRQYNSDNGVKEESGMHTKHSTFTDLNKMLSQLTESSVFVNHPGRSHRNFPKLSQNIIKRPNKQKLIHWMQDHMNKLIVYNYLNTLTFI